MKKLSVLLMLALLLFGLYIEAKKRWPDKLTFRSSKVANEDTAQVLGQWKASWVMRPGNNPCRTGENRSDQCFVVMTECSADKMNFYTVIPTGVTQCFSWNKKTSPNYGEWYLNDPPDNGTWYLEPVTKTYYKGWWTDKAGNSADFKLVKLS